MKRCIRVECWADAYFFGKLLKDEYLINKQQNKTQVIKSFKDKKSAGVFSVGIVDSDNDLTDPFLKGLTIEDNFFVCDELQIIKIEAQPHFIIVLHPKEFEKWIVKFLDNICQKTLNDFGYEGYKNFENDSKEIKQKILTNDKLMMLFKYVLSQQANSDNHISKLKKILEYLVKNLNEADINELKNA